MEDGEESEREDRLARQSIGCAKIYSCIYIYIYVRLILHVHALDASKSQLKTEAGQRAGA